MKQATRIRRVGVGVTAGALLASGFFTAAVPAQAAATPTTVKVTNADIRPDESSYAGWHQGYANAAYASAITSRGLESTGKSQILYGFANNSNADLASDGVNADLSEDLVGAAYDVKSGEASLQVPLFADLDGAGPGAAVFTTLRPAVPAKTATIVTATDEWMSSRPLGDIPANTAKPLSELIKAIEGGTYKTIGIGVLTYETDSVVSSITFNGKKYVFTQTTSTQVVRDSNVKPEETASSYTSWHQGYANAFHNAQVTANGLELAGKSQVIKGFNNNSANVKGVNANLHFAIPEASYTVAEGTAFFQIPLFFDNGSGVKFTTLRNLGAGAGTNKLSLADQWMSSKDLGSIAANTAAPLGDIIKALGAYKVIGYGVLSAAGSSAVVSSIQFNGITTTFSDAAPAPTTSTVVPGSIAPDESVYAGWHQGGTPSTPASIENGTLKLGPDRSQVMKGYEDNSVNTESRNVDLAEALRTGSYDVTSGAVFFQVPLFFEDASGDTRFATLRPATQASVGTNTFGIGDEWMASRAIGSLPANTPALLGDILSAMGSYKVLGFGVYSDPAGNGVVKSITWDGVKYVFDQASSSISAKTSYRPTSTKRFSISVTVTSAGGFVAGDTVRITYVGKTIGTGVLDAQGKATIKLTQTLKKGTRAVTVRYAGGTTTKASSKRLEFRVR